MKPEVVFDGRHLRAVLLPGHKDRLVVTFDYRLIGRAEFTADTHSSNFARGGYAQLSIKTRMNDWFITPDTRALEQALAGVAARYAHVSLLGYSMGGYGALRYAGALGAETAVLISPQFSIAPDVVPWEQRYPMEGLRFDPDRGDLVPVAVSGLRGMIVLDPFVAPDMAHARLIRAHFPGLELARLAFGGHPAIRVIRGAGKVWTIHREAVSAAPERRLICAEHRAARRESQGYWRRLALRAGERRPALAVHATAKAAGLSPRAGDAPGDM
jgi:pimeloyl-ACP methyl ester carboxylesterase